MQEKRNQISPNGSRDLGGQTPYDAALKTLGEDVLKAFQLKPISPDREPERQVTGTDRKICAKK